MTRLHETFEEYRIRPSGLLWPSTVATVLFAGTLLVVWVHGLITGFGAGASLADTAFGQALFVNGAMLAAVLLIAFVAYDVRRHTERFWRSPRLVIGVLEIALLSATLLLLWRAASML